MVLNAELQSMNSSGPGGRGQCGGLGQWHHQLTYLTCRQTEVGPAGREEVMKILTYRSKHFIIVELSAIGQ